MEQDSAIVSLPSLTEHLPLDEIFRSSQPVEVDVGCGKGRFLLARAGSNPQTNFLGLDRQLARLKKTNRKIIRSGLSNVRLLRIEAGYAVRHLLPPLSVSAFFILFPDPWPKRRHHRRRLFRKTFTDAVHLALMPGGLLHVATDHPGYYEQISSMLDSDTRFDSLQPFEPAEEERTDFEILFLKQGALISRCSFAKKQADAQQPCTP